MGFDPRTAFDLTGRTALVTGGSRGLGREIADGLARAGATVIVASRNLESCETAAREIHRNTGAAAHPAGLHVGKWDTLDPSSPGSPTRTGRSTS